MREQRANSRGFNPHGGLQGGDPDQCMMPPGSITEYKQLGRAHYGDFLGPIEIY